MNEELSVRIKCSVDDYVKALTYMQRQVFINKYAFIILPVIIFTAIVLFIFFLSNDKSTIKPFIVILIALVPALIVGALIYSLNRFLNPLILKYNISKQYESSPAMQKESIFTISDEGITSDNGLTSGTVRWEAIVKAFESQTAFFFYTSSKFAQFVPKRIFESQTDINFVRCLARAKLGDKAKF